jgi:hypothetical protein
MGSSGSFPNGHYNAQAKSQIRWLPTNFVQSVNQSGVYHIHAFDQTSLDPANRYAMTIVKDAQRTYWGEVRGSFTSNPWTQRGMLLGWRFPSGSGSNIQLIDTTPGTPTGNSSKNDAPISLGSTFSDFEAGIHLTTVNVNDSPRYVEIVVNLGDFPSNRKPTLALASSAEVVPVGATVTLTASADDPDGDPLAYSWQHFGDTNYRVVEANAPVITRTFPAAGTYVVSCTVSDTKGGTVMKSRLITFGSGNGRITISGRITSLGEGLPNVIVTANGANGVVTDSDGYYTIPNLAANTYTMSPLLYGYSFGELFQNSVTVGPGFTGADFDAVANATVRIEASMPDANELAPDHGGTLFADPHRRHECASDRERELRPRQRGQGNRLHLHPRLRCGQPGIQHLHDPGRRKRARDRGAAPRGLRSRRTGNRHAAARSGRRVCALGRSQCERDHRRR